MKKKLAVTAGALVVLLAAAALVELTIEARETPPQAAFVQIGNAKVRYQLLGQDKPGAPVVFINGIGASLEQWGSLQTAVAAFSPAIAYDRGGAGFSSGVTGFDAQAQAGELNGLLDALQIHRPVVLVGYSFSASIARIFAARHPDRTAGLVLAVPYMAAIERDPTTTHGPFRRYWRWLLHENFVTLFGLRRLSNALHAVPISETQRVLQRFSHWLAVDREWSNIRQSQYEMEATPEPDVPPVIIITSPMTGLVHGPPMMKLYRDFERRSRKGEVRILDRLDHEKALNNPQSLAALTAAIRDLVQ
ncbi:MAG TPA: alpha/beta hydrolase [Myxococcales bacterium]|nr:alpha/beta hydrolase [Myxococcales bacterium]